MKKIVLLCTTVLSATVFMITDVHATSVPGTSTKLTTTQEKTQTEQQTVKAHKDLLISLYQAQVSLHHKNKVDGEKYIDTAMQQLAYIPATASTTENKPTDNKNIPYNGYKIIELELGTTITPEQADIPVPESELTVTDIKNAVEMDGLEKGDIKDAEVKYVTFAVDKETIQQQLTEAKKQLTEDDFYSAQYNIMQAQDAIMKEYDQVPARVKARDHIALTRFLIRRTEYDAAQQSLGIAEDALDQIEDGDNVAAAKDVQKDIKSLSETISKHDPSTIDRIEKTLDQWWTKLSQL